MSKSKYSKLRGIVGNSIVLLFSIFALAFMALPYSAVTMTVESISIRREGMSVFEAMGHIADVSDAAGKTSLVFFILVAVVACVLIVTSIVGLVGAIMGKKQLNMTLVNRVLSIVLVVLALVALITAVVYVSTGNGIVSGMKTSVSGGSVLPMVFAIFTVVGAFVATTKKKS